MSQVQVRENVFIKVSRRSLCDNCIADVCFYNHGQRVTRCERFTPAVVAFRRCARCGEVFEVMSNALALDQDLCQRCNQDLWTCIRV